VEIIDDGEVLRMETRKEEIEYEDEKPAATFKQADRSGAGEEDKQRVLLLKQSPFKRW